jgi:hypothetical protein
MDLKLDTPQTNQHTSFDSHEEVLKKYPEISSYNNDYHSRFGFGATEIFLD